MQPSAANVTNVLFFFFSLCSFKQSKSAVRLKEDMKKIAALPLNKQRDTTCPKVFGVSLLELQQQGLSKNGIPIVVWNIVEYLTQHGKLYGVTFA